MKGWKLAMIAVAALVVGVPAGWAIIDRPTSATDGPLDGGVGWVDGQPVEVGDPYTMGSVLLLNEADEPAIIEKVRLLGTHGPLKLHGVLSRSVSGAQEQALSSGEDAFPPVGFPAEPLDRLNVVPVARTRTEAGTPGEGVQLFFGVEITEPGVAWAERVEVTYTVAGRRYREKFDRAFALCAPADRYLGACSDQINDQLPF